MVSDHAERTFERLRYSFGGDRPSQTARLTMSPDRIHGRIGTYPTRNFATLGPL